MPRKAAANSALLEDGTLICGEPEERQMAAGND